MKKKRELRLTAADVKCLEQAKEFILNNLSRHFTIRTIASEAGINRYKLTYGFRILFGVSVDEFAKAEKMKKALELLRETDKSVKEIASICGYHKTSNFSTAFKKYFSIRPGYARSRKK
jgi:AraC-like DNA-binding protein